MLDATMFLFACCRLPRTFKTVVNHSVCIICGLTDILFEDEASGGRMGGRENGRGRQHLNNLYLVLTEEQLVWTRGNTPDSRPLARRLFFLS